MDIKQHILLYIYATIKCCSTKEELLSEMTLVDATSRERLVRSIPTSGQGETCIGCGVRLALQVRCPICEEIFQNTLNIAQLFLCHQVLGKRNGIMVLVTDGQNTEPDQFISNIQAEVTESGTKVVAVGFGYAFMSLSILIYTLNNVKTLCFAG